MTNNNPNLKVNEMYKLLRDNEVTKQYLVDDHFFFYNKQTGFSMRQPVMRNSAGDVHWPAEAFDDKFELKHALILKDMFDMMGLKKEDPFWCTLGPELLDICITEQCNRACPYCYQSATHDGEHMPLDLYSKILFQTHRTVTQIALGGGEVTMHPDIVEILRLTREDYGIVPNYTTNGDWLLDKNLNSELLEATKKHCGAVAVSAHGDRKDWEYRAILLAQEGVKTNIHFILGEDTAEEAAALLRASDLSPTINAIIFLLYKPVGRASESGVLKSPSKIRDFLEALKETKLKIGFDACSAPMIVSMTDIDTVSFDSCEGGRFSGYVHVDGQVKACSFDKSKGANINDKSFVSIWQGELQKFRDALKGCPCECDRKLDCMGGCPFERSIVICDKKERKC